MPSHLCTKRSSLLTKRYCNTIAVVQSLSHVQFFLTPWTAARQSSLSFIISPSLFKLMSIELVMPSNHLILCCPLLLLPSIFLRIRIFSNVFVPHIRWSKYWSFSFNTNPSNEYSGWISFRIDWTDLLAAEGLSRGFLQHHSLKASILLHSTLFTVLLSHPHMTNGKTIALKIWGVGLDRGWDGWIASLTWRTWVWASPRSWWWAWKPVCCSLWGCKELDMTEWLNSTELTLWTLCQQIDVSSF